MILTGAAGLAVSGIGLDVQNFAPDDPCLLSVLKRIRQWHLEAYNKDTGRSLREHFKVAESLN